MPKRKIFKKPKRVGKRVFRRRTRPLRSKRRAGRSVPRPLRVRGKVIPDSVFVKLPYTNNINLSTASTNAMVTWTLRGNNPGDPEYSTSINYSSYGWSYWSQLYKRCVCYGSRLRVTYQAAASSSTAFSIEMNRAGFQVDTDTVPPSAFLDRVLHPRVGRWTNINSAALGYKNQKTLKAYCSTSKALGVPKKAPQSDEIYSFPTDLTTYPQKDWYWHLWAKNKDTSSTTHVNCDFTIVYFCKFYDPKDDAIEPTEPSGEFDDPNGDDLIPPEDTTIKERPDPPAMLSAPPEPEISIDF